MIYTIYVNIYIYILLYGRYCYQIDVTSQYSFSDIIIV